MSKHNQARRLTLCAAISVITFGGALTAHAQDRAPAIEEIVVSAERRQVSLQEVPISAVALSGDVLEQRGVDTFDDLQYQVPSLTFTDNGNSKFLNIRGVGISESAPNQTVGVAVHLDGGYIAREFVYGDAFFDLESVEVLRGPQGTYAGQNASGGAIFINSRKPVLGETSGFAGVEYGNYDHRSLSAGVSFPISENLAGRISGQWESRDSFYENHGPLPTNDPDRIENQPGNVERSFARFQLLYQPSDELEARLIHENSQNDTDGIPYKDFPEPGSNDLPGSGARDLYWDMETHRNVSYDRTTLQVDWAASEAFSVVGNLSYLTSHQHYLADQGSDVTPQMDPTAVQAGADYTIQDEYWTGELTLVSALDGPLEWTVGASFLDYEQDNYLNFLRYNDPAGGYPGTGLDLTRHTRLHMYLNNLRSNEAAFGEVGYYITPDLQVKVGVRYNQDEVGFSDDSYLSAGPPPAGRDSHYNSPTGMPLRTDELLEFEETTGRVLVNWTPADGQLFYSTVSRGYKPGGTTPVGNEYKSEQVTNYELGWKGDLFERLLSGGISVYYMEYDQYQRTYSPDPFNPAESLTYNVDGSTIQGIEAQLNGYLGDFSWDLSLAFSDGEYGDLEVAVPAGAIDGVNPVDATLINLKGQPIDYLPETSYNLGVAYQGFELEGGQLMPRIRVSYQDEFYTSFYHFEQNLTPEKTLVDVFVDYETTDWTLSFFAKNATDEEYISRAQAGNDSIGSYLLGAPRTIGAKFRYQF